MPNNEILLCDNVRAKIKQIVDIVAGKDNKRITIQLISDYPDSNRTLKNYYIWIDPEYATKHGYDKLDDDVAQTISFQTMQRQFDGNGKVIPIEDGIYLSDNEEIIVDPQSFNHPLEI